MDHSPRRTPAASAAVSARPQPLTNVTYTERTYLRLVLRHGHRAPHAKQLDLQKPVADDGQTDCWTHAWQVAQRTGADYVEGLCVRAGAGGPSFHAWVEHDHPLTGRTVVECTPGYRDASQYLGITVDCTPSGHIDQLTRHWHTRASVLQALLAGGTSPAELLTAVRPQPSPQPGLAASKVAQ